MMDTRTNHRKTSEKLAIFRACFSGLPHVYGSYDPASGRAFQVKRPVTDAVLLAHLRSQRPYGVYLLVGDRTGAVVADFDHDDTGPPQQYVRCAAELGISAYIEFSKRKGSHVWIFAVAGGVLAAKARRLAQHLLHRIGLPKTEVFPKHDRLGPQDYGNYLNAPLWALLVPKGRTVFVNPDAGFAPYPDQWELLANVRRITDKQLDSVLPSVPPAAESNWSLSVRRITRVRGGRSIALPPCAVRMLAEGVRENQRVATFRLAIALKLARIGEDLAVACLCAWAKKNRPADGHIIAEQEIREQVHCAYWKDYRGHGCEEGWIRAYCDPPGCPILGRSAPSISSAAPAGVTTSNAPREEP